MLAGFPVYNMLAPTQGPKALNFPIPLDVAGIAPYDLVKEQDCAQIELVQSVFVVNKTNANIAIAFNESGYELNILANSSGMFPVISGGHLRFTISNDLALVGETLSLIFLNVPQPYFSFAI